jgi:hypothetical protein
MHRPASRYKKTDDPELKQSGTTRSASSSPTKRIRIVLAFVVLSLLYTLTHVCELPHRLRGAIPGMATVPTGYKKCIVYHADWVNYARNFQVSNLATFMGGISDVCYAFFNLQARPLSPLPQTLCCILGRSYPRTSYINLHIDPHILNLLFYVF